MSAKTISPEIRAMFLYIRAGIMLFPLLVMHEFSRMFLMPKLRDFWTEAGTGAQNASGVMAIAESIIFYFYPALLAIVVVVALLELTVRVWRRFRALGLDALIFIYCVALTGLQVIAAITVVTATVVVAKQ